MAKKTGSKSKKTNRNVAKAEKGQQDDAVPNPPPESSNNEGSSSFNVGMISVIIGFLAVLYQLNNSASLEMSSAATFEQQKDLGGEEANTGNDKKVVHTETPKFDKEFWTSGRNETNNATSAETVPEVKAEVQEKEEEVPVVQNTEAPSVTEAPSSNMTSPPPAMEVSLAAFHDPFALEVKDEDLIRYLQYDDGYTACLEKANLDEDDFGVWSLKKAKFQYLKKIARSPQHWIVKVPRDDEDGEPDQQKVLTTMRVLSFLHDDFDGMDELKLKLFKKENMRNWEYGKYTSALEWRSLAAASRFTDMWVRKHGASSTNLDALRLNWFEEATKMKEQAEKDPSIPISVTWVEHRKPEHKFSYFQKKTSTTSTWIRPTARPGEPVNLVEPGEVKSNIIVRGRPCDYELQLPLLE